MPKGSLAKVIELSLMSNNAKLNIPLIFSKVLFIPQYINAFNKTSVSL